MHLQRSVFLSQLKDTGILGTGLLANILSHILIPKAKGALIIDTIHGFKIKVDPVEDNGVERQLYYFGSYEKGTLNIMEELLSPGNTFIDVGANIGLMTIHASKIVGKNGRVFSFEPNPKTRSILEENIYINQLQNVEIVPKAVSAEIKRSKIYDRWDVNRGGASLIKPDIESSSYDIEETTLNEFFKEDVNIDLIKIDIEGYELEALKGALDILRRKNAPSLIIECSSDRNNTFGESLLPLYNFIKGISDYRIFKSKKGKGRKSALIEVLKCEELPSHDNIYCFTENSLKTINPAIFKKKK